MVESWEESGKICEKREKWILSTPLSSIVDAPLAVKIKKTESIFFFHINKSFINLSLIHI